MPPTPPIDPWLWNDTPVPAILPARPITVSRYAQAAGGGAVTLTPLPNVEALSVAQAMGTDPGRARFRYNFVTQDAQAPSSVEQAISTSFTGTKVINPGDKLVVIATMPDGTPDYLFYGTAIGFAVYLQSETEEVHINAVGIAKAQSNVPIRGARRADGVNPVTDIAKDTDLPAQFNPKGIGNAIVNDGYETATFAVGGDQKFPVFVDPTAHLEADAGVVNLAKDRPTAATAWTLAAAARYLIFTRRDAFDAAPGSADRIITPGGADLDALLVARQPKAGAAFDPADASTYDARPILVSDTPITGRDWPSVLNDLVRDKGFSLWWQTGAAADGSANVRLRLEATHLGPVKDLYLQARGAMLDPALSNVAAMAVERDINQLVNQWTIIGGQRRKEASFVLAPGYLVKAGDSDTLARIDEFTIGHANYPGKENAYRRWILDECGEGHYDNASSQVRVNVPPLDEIYEDTSNYNRRHQKPIGTLLTTDGEGKPLKWSVALSTDYAGPYPAIWDRTGKWQTVDGGVELLTDQVGIRVTTTNPNQWKVGTSTEANNPFRNGIVKLVEAMATPPSVANPRLFVRLTCVIETDKAVTGRAVPTTASALPETIERIIDARDRYRHDTVTHSSHHNDGSPDQVVRDDSDNAKAEAIAHRSASEAGVLAGTVTIPYITRNYKIGDRIRQVSGRGLPFRTDGGTGSTGQVYPVVIGVEHELSPGQTTTLRLSDADGHRTKIAARLRRR